MRSMLTLQVVLPFFLVAVLTHSLSLAAVAQNRAQKESASFKNVEETVSKLLSVPVYMGSDEKLLNEAGDGAALAITRIVSEQEMNSPDTGRRILLILHLAFEAPPIHHRAEQQDPDGSTAFAQPVGAYGLRAAAQRNRQCTI